MKRIYLTSLVTSLTITSATLSVALPATASKSATAPTKKDAPTTKVVKKKLKAIPSKMTLAELQENIFFYEPSCRAAAVGIATNFGAQGSGVIASPEGVVLTAAHVVDEVGAEFFVYLSDGRRLKAVCLLINAQTDSAIGKIIEPVPNGGFPFRPIRTSTDLVKGDWCTVIANGGGIQLNRPAPLRVGRILTNKKNKQQNVLTSDCTVTSGDSGGPLFDTDGNVCGINSAVGAGSALNNMHISSETFIQQWGEYLVEGKALPTIDEVKKKELARKKKAGESLSSIPKALLPQIRKALQKKYPELPAKAVEAMLNHSTFNAGNLRIKATPKLVAQFKKLGLDPSKYGFSPKKSSVKDAGKAGKPKKSPKATQAKKAAAKPAQARKPATTKNTPAKKKLGIEDQIKALFGDIPAPALEFLKKKALSNKKRNINLTAEDEAKLKKLGVDMENFQLRKTATAKFGKMSEPAMKFLLSKFHKGAKGKYELKVSESDISKLNSMGVNILGQKGKKQSKKQMLDALFKKRYGANISKEALEILHSAALLDPKTGQLRLNFDASKLKKLLALGVKINTSGGAHLDPFEVNHGDSSASIAKLFPTTPESIHLLQSGKHIGLATAISAEGKFLSKSSSIKGDKGLTISISGKIYPASVLARDKEADLALITASLLRSDYVQVPEWGDTPRRGKLIVSSAEGSPMLGVVSVDKRIVPAKTIGVGNGNKAILGVISDITKKVDGSYIQKVQPGTPAEKGGIIAGDIITSVGGSKVSSQAELREQVGKYQGGDVVKFTVKRGDKTLDLMITLLASEKSDMFSSDATNSAAQDLSALAGELSPRRTTFPEAFSHDALIWNNDCGGPVYTIDGKLLGINIARYSRITNYALTQKSVNEALERMGHQ